MSERKVLNKYYPPDFDASKLPRVKREKNRQFVIRLMAPFNMRCTTCGEYIYRGKKFNARKEDVIGKTYLGIQIYRFYIKCTKCLAEITFLTDPENQDYAMEFGALRNFESVRLAEIQAEKESKAEKEEEENNPMKILENRTRDSRREMAVLETLEDLRELNAANSVVDPNILFKDDVDYQKKLEEREKEEDEAEIRRIFGKKHTSDLNDDNEEIVEDLTPLSKKHKLDQNNDQNESNKKIKVEVEEPEEVLKSNSVLFKKPANPIPNTLKPLDMKSKISSLIKKKPEPEPETSKLTAAQSNPLANLASYSSDDESDED